MADLLLLSYNQKQIVEVKFGVFRLKKATNLVIKGSKVVSPMRVGIISDTHIQSLDGGIELAEKLLRGPFSAVDVILHAGDHIFPDLASCFYPLPWYSVRGNMDSPQPDFPPQRVVQLADTRIGMIHGWGAPSGIEKRVLESFSTADIDVLVFGHSHRPVCRRVGSVLLLNPGSPTDRRSAPHHTVGLLHIGQTGQGVEGEIIRID